jgi:outer membrane protein assembly factor BamB
MPTPPARSPCIAWILLLAACEAAHAAAPAEQARHLLEQSGVQGGLVIHLGCGKGHLTAALRADPRYLVQGLDKDAEKISEARQHIQSQGLYGTVAAVQWDEPTLPYVDNLANLVVVEDAGRVPMGEVMRVLAPGGTALVKRDGAWATTRKPRPESIDEWTHYLHDATNNAVAQDTAIGPPRHLQWTGSPRWTRHHDFISSLTAVVSAGGRLFYVVDQGPRWSLQMPAEWSLVARDAFNGTPLWERALPSWHTHLWPLKSGPAQLPRRLVAVGDRVYLPLGSRAPLSALDAATGETVRTYAGTAAVEEVIASDGRLFVLADPTPDERGPLPETPNAIRKEGRAWPWDKRPRTLLAIDASSGQVQWQRQGRVVPLTLAAAEGRLYLHDGEHIRCLDAGSGKPVWESKPIARWSPLLVLFGPTLVVHNGVVLFAGGEKMTPRRGGRDSMTALSAESGKVLWTAPHPPSGYASPEDLFVINNQVWTGETTNRGHSGIFTGRDLRTGEVVKQFPPDDPDHMPHHRCHRAKATSKYILASRTGIEFVDLQAEHWIPHHWVRGSCLYGILPANGLVYAPPHSCACYLLAKLNGFNALAAQSPSRRVPRNVPQAERLLRGPAYEDAAKKSPARATREDWPTYRHDAERSGSTPVAVPAKLNAAWRAEVGGTLSALTVADGRVFVASVDRHTVHALDAKTGRGLWSYRADGRVDSPPTVWRQRVLFGSADGYVTCLRAADGALAWRFRAAPVDRRLVSYGQVESVWPVHGSVLVRDGVVYCVAGRSMFLDGGLRFLRLDAASGRMLSETVLDNRDPQSGKPLQAGLRWPNLPTALPDILSCDGQRVYMRTQPFDLEGRRPEVFTARRYSEQKGEKAHLFSPTGFLDGSWWHRSYWVYGRSFIGGAGGWYLASYHAPAGRILVFDEQSVYGYGRKPFRFVGGPVTYHLFRTAKDSEIVNPNPKRPPRRRGRRVYGEVYRTHPKHQWSRGSEVHARAMVLAGDKLILAGPPRRVDEDAAFAAPRDREAEKKLAEEVAAFRGKAGARLVVVSAADGSPIQEDALEALPVWDGMTAARGRLYIALENGHVLCLGGEEAD